MMAEYRQEFEKRVGQFVGYLKKMYHRSHEEVQGSCFLIFDDRPPENAPGRMNLHESVKPSLELAFAAFNDQRFAFSESTDELFEFELPNDGWKEDDSQNRFVQYSFEKNWFCMDLPHQTLYRPEANQILRSRNGFFYVRDRPQFTLKGEDVDGYDPFRKIYIYGDEDSAAEDMAFIFFNVWKFPVNWRFFVKAAAFGDKETNWENGVPIE